MMRITIRPLILISLIILASSIVYSYNLIQQQGSKHPLSTIQLVFGDTKTSQVNIPKGAASPEIDITKLTPTQWYVPSRISVSPNDSVTWVNNDTEIHTVTSGTGAGLESLINNKQGKKDGLFDSLNLTVVGRTSLRSLVFIRTFVRYTHGWKELY